jgi:phytoene desaturase
MPDVFERFFDKFDHDVSDFYQLQRLDPSFTVVFAKDDVIQVPARIEEIEALFESIEAGSASRLRKFLSGAKYKYEVGMRDLVYKPGLSWSEYLDMRVIRGALRLGVFQSYATHVRKYFSDPRLIKLMEFPVLFLGGTPKAVPALYSLMAYGGLALGTWYPMGGMYSVVEGMYQLARKLGVRFQFNEEVTQLQVAGRRVDCVKTTKGEYFPNHVVATADYHHVEHNLLSEEHRMYRDTYWDRRVLAPSAVIYYLGVDRKLPGLNHHNLFFDAPYDVHAEAIYGKAELPDNPLFYVCTPSVSDKTVAPDGHENLFILVPLSTRLEDTPEMRDTCFERVMARLESYLGIAVRKHIIYNRSYAMDNFRQDYHALRGNAYGLANTLMQTAKLKPRIKSNRVDNLVYAGQMTVPGPGVPPALISGDIAASLISVSSDSITNKAGHATKSL